MTETQQTAGSCASPAVRVQATGVLGETRSRFEGDGVRYKAKLIGMDPVPHSQGEKMCLDSMMKLKGFEVAERKMGKHKMRIWLKISSNGLKIVDERSGVCLHDQERTRISSVTKDKSDPRALAYIYKHEQTYILFYIKTATQADPVLSDIMEVCQHVDQEATASHQPAENQDISLVVLNDGGASPEMGEAHEKVLDPPPDSSSGQTHQTSTSNELMQIFSPPMKEPLTPDQILSVSQTTGPAESPQQLGLSTAQILSMFPTQPPGGSPYISPPVSPHAMPWGQQGLLGNQTGFWPSVPAGGPAGVMAPPAGLQPQPGFMMTMSPAAPPSLTQYPNPSSSTSVPDGRTAAPRAPAMDGSPLL